MSDNFNHKLYEINIHLENDELESTIQLLNSAVQDACKLYTEKLHRYPVNVVKSKNETLTRRLKDLVDPVFDTYCEKIEKKSIKIFEYDFISVKNSTLTTALINDSIERAITFYKTSLQRKFAYTYIFI